MTESAPTISKPAQMTGGPVYLPDPNGRWYPVVDPATGEPVRWPSNATLGLPEGPTPCPFCTPAGIGDIRCPDCRGTILIKDRR